METRERRVAGRTTPQKTDGRWFLEVGATALIAGFLAYFPVVRSLEAGLFEEWPLILLAAGPFALAGLITGYVGGLRAWWLTVPVAAVYLNAGAFLLDEGSSLAWLYLLSLWCAMVFSTWLVRVLTK